MGHVSRSMWDALASRRCNSQRRPRPRRRQGSHDHRQLGKVCRAGGSYPCAGLVRQEGQDESHSGGEAIQQAIGEDGREAERADAATPLGRLRLPPRRQPAQRAARLLLWCCRRRCIRCAGFSSTHHTWQAAAVGGGSCGICRWRQAAAVQRVVPSGSWSRTALQARALGVWARSRAAASCTARRTEGRHGLLALARGERRGAESPGWPKCRGIGAALAAREGEARGAGRQTCGSAAMLPPAPRSCLRPSNPQPTLLLTVVEGKLRAWLGIYCTVEGLAGNYAIPRSYSEGMPRSSSSVFRKKALSRMGLSCCSAMTRRYAPY